MISINTQTYLILLLSLYTGCVKTIEQVTMRDERRDANLQKKLNLEK